MNILFKQCKKCLEEKTVNDFHKHKASAKQHLDGLSYYCKLCVREKHQKDKKAYSERTLRWKASNPERWKEKQRIINRKKSKKPISKYRQAIRKEIREKLKTNSIKFSPNLGCSSMQLKQYIEKQFALDMNWENRGLVWEIDHIVPICAFTQEERKYVNHYLNIRPIYPQDNYNKGYKWNPEDKAALVENIKKLQAPS